MRCLQVEPVDTARRHWWLRGGGDADPVTKSARVEMTEDQGGTVGRLPARNCQLWYCSQPFPEASLCVPALEKSSGRDPTTEDELGK